ncbi:phosphocholine-specific phospholipase C [Streptomyces sp. 8L]|uniref:phosphocholine-specific phospholipase C n=1 Tax=Streptomyces sp. 8L TaxID=2877242 RepID=UPI001CD1EDE1|nr:phospholipase C, phosphocholine-specific [Streptomyces sp. 8L]MCA1217544.1 phospholipase C, phosphocholine-specific [Streptomyces sp. 8L]
MVDMNRRRFMQLAGGTAAFSALSTSIARAASIPANHRTGSLRDIEHIVVLMQENRSFDMYFGSLGGVRGFADPRAVTLPGGKSVFHQPGPSGDVLPFHPPGSDLGLTFLEDLDHSWEGTHAAFNRGKYDSWVSAKSAASMAYLTRDDIPFHYAMADAFTVCDAYHCSLLGPTDPNRYYMWSGYVGGDGTGGGPVITNDELRYGWTTYPERLERAGVSWKIYQDRGNGLDAAGSWGWTDDAYIGNYGDNSLLYFDSYRDAQPGDPLYEKARTGTNAAAGDGFMDILKADVKAGRLPQISWIAAPEAFSEHPNWPANYGAWYVSQVIDALTVDPEVWSRTALLITYDENDGYFDHVVPPFPPSSPAQGFSTVSVEEELFGSRTSPSAPASSGAGPYGLGMRVPMFVLSPWSRGGRVCSEVFDHTSILRFMERRFGVAEPHVSPWRRAVTGDLTSAFDFSRASSSVPALPSTDRYRPKDAARHPDVVPRPPADQALPRQERDRRPLLPAPYDLAADAVAGEGRLTVGFASHGTAGAAFLVTSTTSTEGPWTYTVGPHAKLTGTLALPASGAYDYSVHGPNGFLRQVSGTGPARGAEVTAVHDAARGTLRLRFANHGTVPVRLTVRDGYGHAHDASVRLRPGASAEHTVEAARTDHWYDVSVTSDRDDTYLRRLAGHIETGRASVTDPALARG